jgi:hypothetical protein
MKPGTRTFLIALAVVALVIAVALLVVSRTPSLHQDEALRIAVDAYIYGYPLVTFDMARRQQTNVAVRDGEHAPMGQLIKMRSYPAVDNRCCAAPNADTLYTIVWLDVSDEPWVFGIPEMGERYYIMPMLDGYSEVFFAASPRTTGSSAQTYAITGPGWSGALPEGVTRVDSPTAMVWILGRIYCLGTPEDYVAVHALQDRFTVAPLSAYGKPYTPPPAAVDPSFDMNTAVRKQVNGLDVYDYFGTLAQLLKLNPPKPHDAAVVAEMARIGLAIGQDFDTRPLRSLGPVATESGAESADVSTAARLADHEDQSGLPHFSQGVGVVEQEVLDTGPLGSLDRKLIRIVPKLALLKMAKRLKDQETTNGWLYFTEGVGNFGTDYLLRGMANLLGPGWNRPEDAVYPLSREDADGNAYDGAAHDYVMRFEAGRMPPVEAFWSLTMYDKDLFFVPNPIDRHTLSQRDHLVPNSDGSVDLYIQAEPPGPEREANWLPAPKGRFQLVLRMYGPTTKPPSIVDGSWAPPPVERVR